MKERIKAAVENYTGEKVAELAIHPDPKVEGVYAVRARLVDCDCPLDFLWNVHEAEDEQPIGRMTADSLVLEECEFSQWPPKSGKLKFFV